MLKTAGLFAFGISIALLATLLLRPGSDLLKEESDRSAGNFLVGTPDSAAAAGSGLASHDELMRRIAELEDRVSELERELRQRRTAPQSEASDNNAVTRPGETRAASESPSGPTTERVGQSSETPLQGLAMLTRRTPEEVERILERSFAFQSEFRDRHERFADEVADASEALPSLENTVANYVSQVAGSTLPPVFMETECRLSGCRVRLTYGTNEDLLAAAGSSFDMRVLVGLEPYGFEAAESRPGRASGSQGPILDVFFWRRAEEAGP